MSSDEDNLKEFFGNLINTDRDTQIDLATLKYHVLGDDVDEFTLGPETLKYRLRMRKKGLKHFSVTLAPEFRGTAEDIAAALNKSEDWLDDPVNHLISRIEGHLFGKKETVMCMKQSITFNQETGGFEKIPLTREQEYEIKKIKEDIDLFNMAIEMIKDLNSQLKYKTVGEPTI